MDISIIIVNFNTKDLVLECVSSIIKSKPKVSFEIIIIDNGSDGGNRIEIQKSKYKLIMNKDNLGFARAVNQGIKKKVGKNILLLNSDTVIKKETLDRLVNFASNIKDVGVVGARLLNIDGSTQPSCFRLPTLWRTVAQYWFGDKGLLDKYYPYGINPVQVEAVVGGAFLITPEALKKVGLLDERYFMYFEDLDYCCRVRNAELKVYYLPMAEIVHYHGASGKALVSETNQWRRLIPSSIIYHGLLKHYIIFFITWTGQKWQKLSHYFH